MLVKKSLFWSKESRKNQVLPNFINKQLKISLILTKKTLFTIRNKQKIDKKVYYWVKKYRK